VSGDGVFWPEFESWLDAHGIEANDCRRITVLWDPEFVRRGISGPVHMEVILFEREDGHLVRAGERCERCLELAKHRHALMPMRHLPAVEVVRYREEP